MWVQYKWEAEIIDFKTAYLYGNLDEEIYLKIPNGYKKIQQKENQK